MEMLEKNGASYDFLETKFKQFLSKLGYRETLIIKLGDSLKEQYVASEFC